MKFLIILLIVFGCLSCETKVNHYDMAIKNITIIDTEGAKLLPNQTIYIDNDRIVKITTSNLEKKALTDTIIDGTDKFILPGFWDMHVHTTWSNDLDKTMFPVFLQYGITGLRDMGGRLDILNTFKEKAKNQPKKYPNLYGSGPILDGETPIHPDFSVSVTPNNFRPILDSLKNNQVDFFKVYTLLSPETLDSIAKYSKAHNINFSGHFSAYISPVEAAKSGQKSFEHINGLEQLQNDSLAFNSFIKTATQNQSWICPTLVIYQRKHEINKGQFFYHSLFKTLNKDLKIEWENYKTTNSKNENDNLEATDSYNLQKQLVKLFYDNEIPMLIGTDFAGMPFVYPGYSYHEEMKLMQDIGISQFDILKMATLNPTVFLGISETYGTVEKGKIADLVILNANPIENIENTQAIDVVIKSGVVVDHKNGS